MKDIQVDGKCACPESEVSPDKSHCIICGGLEPKIRDKKKGKKK